MSISYNDNDYTTGSSDDIGISHTDLSVVMKSEMKQRNDANNTYNKDQENIYNDNSRISSSIAIK